MPVNLNCKSFFSKTFIPIFKLLELFNHFKWIKAHWSGPAIDQNWVNAIFKIAFAVHNKEKEMNIQEKILMCNFNVVDIDEYELNKTR